MAYDYDALYAKTPNALGEPTKIFVDFFSTLPKTHLRVIDVGCSQGRDALFIARLGHAVLGVDLSPNGICDLNAAAKRENLDINGIVADITAFKPDKPFDVVLIDRTLHMLDKPARLRALHNLLPFVKPKGWLLIADETTNIADFVDLLDASGIDWVTHTRKRGYLFCQRTA